MHKFAVTVTLVLCCSTGHAQYAPAELFYQQNVQRATVGTIHEYVPGSYHNLQSPTGITVQDRFQEEENLLNIQRDQSPTGTTVQDRFPLTQPVLRSPTIQQSKAPQEATEEIKDRYKRELEVTLKHTRALNQPAQLQLRCQRRSRSRIGSVSDQLRQFPVLPLADLVPCVVPGRSRLPLLLRLLPLLRPVVAMRGYRYLLSASTGRATLSCRRRARRWSLPRQQRRSYTNPRQRGIRCVSLAGASG